MSQSGKLFPLCLSESGSDEESAFSFQLQIPRFARDDSKEGRGRPPYQTYFPRSKTLAEFMLS